MYGSRSLLRAPAGEAPEGGASAQPATSAPVATSAPAAQPQAPTQPAPKIDPADPELRKLIAAAAKDAAEKARVEERAKVEEEKRLAQLGVEERAKAEAKKAEETAAAAKAEAERAKAEAQFARALLTAGYVPQTELAESMAQAAAAELVKQGMPWPEAIRRVGTDHAYLFRSQSSSPSQTAAPAAVHAARTLNAGGATPQPAADATAPPEDAWSMTPEQWAAAQRRLAGRGAR